MAENLEGEIFNNWKVIGDTGERNSNRGQVVLARHIETGKVKKISAKNLKHGDSKGLLEGPERKSILSERAIRNFSYQYKEGTNTTIVGEKNKLNKTGYAGVSYDKSKKRWYSQIALENGKNIGLGRFVDFKEAVITRNKKEIELRGELYSKIGKPIQKINKDKVLVNDYVLKKQKEIDKSLLERNKETKNIKMAINSRNTSGYKGVSYHKKNKKWQASITVNYKRIYLGYFTNKQEAIEARLAAEKKYFKPILDKYEKENKS